MQAFAKAKGANFPVFAKVDVNGPSTAPIFTFLKENSPSGGLLGALLGKDIKVNEYTMINFSSFNCNLYCRAVEF